jgi:pimeloyl-ACP methyl ester carboxylesterase
MNHRTRPANARNRRGLSPDEPRVAASPTPEIRQLKANATTFAYVELGEGEPIVMIHGSLGSLHDFANQWGYFGSEYRIFAYSRRFHPPNSIDRTDTEYTIHRHADDLEVVLESFTKGPVHLIGSSWGAYAALALIMRRPDIAHTLVLGEPPILPLLRQSPVGRIFLARFVRDTIDPAREAFAKGDTEDGVRKFADGIIGRKGKFDLLPSDVRKRLLAASAELRLEFETPFESYMPAIQPEELHAVHQPVLLLEGDRSPKLFHLITDELELALPKTERVLVPRAGHSMQTANPRFYNETVQQFLHKHVPRTRKHSS